MDNNPLPFISPVLTSPLNPKLIYQNANLTSAVDAQEASQTIHGWEEVLVLPQTCLTPDFSILVNRTTIYPVVRVKNTRVSAFFSYSHSLPPSISRPCFTSNVYPEPVCFSYLHTYHLLRSHHTICLDPSPNPNPYSYPYSYPNPITAATRLYHKPPKDIVVYNNKHISQVCWLARQSCFRLQS